MILAARFRGGGAVDVVEGEHVEHRLRRFERRHADPQEWHVAGRDRLRQFRGARGILLVPVFRAHRLANAIDQHLLAVVGADHDDDRRRPQRGDQFADLFRPVVEILAHEAGRPAGAVDDLHVGALRKGGGQALGEAASEEIADDQHDARVRTLGDDSDLGRLGAFAQHARLLLLLFPFSLGLGDFGRRVFDAIGRLGVEQPV